MEFDSFKTNLAIFLGGPLMGTKKNNRKKGLFVKWPYIFCVTLKKISTSKSCR